MFMVLAAGCLNMLLSSGLVASINLGAWCSAAAATAAVAKPLAVAVVL
jgi:hypothetical protein